MSDTDAVVVWGNCQAEPLAHLLAAPLAEAGLRVEFVPPVFLIDEEGLQGVHELVARSALLLAQPVRDEYRIPGCGTAQLAELLPQSGRLVTFPVIFHVGAFPFLVNAHGADGERVPAPLTDYHDLRALVAAERGLSIEAALTWWPEPPPAAVRGISADSLAELRRREERLDVTVTAHIDEPEALWTLDHPANRVLSAVAAAVLRVLGVSSEIDCPEREFLGARRAPLESAVLAAHGWSADCARPNWIVDRRPVPPAELLAAHLTLYSARPDVVVDARRRYADRLAVLGI